MTDILDQHGVVAKPGMKARHWGDPNDPEYAGRVYSGTILEYVGMLGDMEVERALYFYYDDAPEHQEERDYLPLDIVTPFEIVP